MRLKCLLCNSSCLSCQQIIATTTFVSTQTKEKFNTCHKVSCKINCHILLECLLCKKQYVRKLETLFHIRLNEDIKTHNAIEACQYFNNSNHTFHKYGKFKLIEQLNNIKNTLTGVLKQTLKDRENYCISRLINLTSCDLNQKLCQLHGMEYFFRSRLFLLSAYGSNI